MMERRFMFIHLEGRSERKGEHHAAWRSTAEAMAASEGKSPN